MAPTVRTPLGSDRDTYLQPVLRDRGNKTATERCKNPATKRTKPHSTGRSLRCPASRLAIPQKDIGGSERIAHNHLMTEAPPSADRPSQPPPAGRGNPKRHFDLNTIIAITVTGVVLIGVALGLAYVSASCPTVGSCLLVVGVRTKGIASLLEAIMKTENDGFWRSEPKRAA